jgi:hypothetical protein
MIASNGFTGAWGALSWRHEGPTRSRPRHPGGRAGYGPYAGKIGAIRWGGNWRKNYAKRTQREDESHPNSDGARWAATGIRQRSRNNRSGSHAQVDRRLPTGPGGYMGQGGRRAEGMTFGHHCSPPPWHPRVQRDPSTGSNPCPSAISYTYLHLSSLLATIAWPHSRKW